ncbi:hypothetical protein CDL12_04897 [Handroanthus impetiginosus]|uniref:J domain-containing protein n=1 Tax=Handroanthus impetiginosus TaxID=429701 RepID=A0A2G9HYH4_9LAMI|nr:hypothetical protein CDL12_04897 [Handroanthus impetiginosus]
MDCNKDDAQRAKEIAEKKLLERDITGAKKFALKAQNLYPNLEGLSQFLGVIDVYVANEKKINGEPDYYGILGVDPFVDEEVLRKQYKRMALSLHPDKNKSVGADGAFQIISEAWSVLSDKHKRTRGQAGSFSSSSAGYTTSATTSQNMPAQPWIPPTATSRQQTPQPPLHQNYTGTQPTWSPHPSGLETFWTICNRCKVHFEYDKIYVNQNLLCACCKKPFLALEVPAPVVNRSFGPFPRQQQDVPTSSSGHKTVPNLAKRTFEAASYQASKKEGPKMSTEVLCRNDEARTKSSITVSEKAEAASVPAPSEVSSGIKREKSAKKRRRDGPSCDSTKELSQVEIRSMLEKKARKEIISQLNELETEKSKSSPMKRAHAKDSVNDLKNDPINCLRTDQRRDDISSDPKNTSQPEKSSAVDESDDVEANQDETVSMVVPDANFHNFDDDRVEDSFIKNQVWAAYDDDDGMPRYYALVHDIISRKPFKIQISWLNYKSTSEFGPLNWIGSGFPKTTGYFRVGKSVVNRRLNSFSHPVKCKKGAKGVIQIFPTKGDVWALYRNWSTDWDELTADETVHKYDLVLVLEDYNEDTGALVVPLVKVAGFTSVFSQVLDQKDIQKIPREEMFRFSHQVPFYTLNGMEAKNAPKGCYELDPAALPLELLNVITDAEAAEERVFEQPEMLSRTDGGGEAMAESSSAGKTHATKEWRAAENVKHIITYARRKKGSRREGDAYQSQK